MSNCECCGQVVPEHEYQVFYCGGYNKTQGTGSLERKVRAKDHFAAVCQAGSYSEHGENQRYIVVGPNTDNLRGEIFGPKNVVRVFKFNQTVLAPDFRTNTTACFGRGYKVTEITLDGKPV